VFLQDVHQAVFLQHDTALKKKFCLGCRVALDSSSGYNMAYGDMDNRYPLFQSNEHGLRQATINTTFSQLHKDPSLWTLQVFK